MVAIMAMLKNELQLLQSIKVTADILKENRNEAKKLGNETINHVATFN